MSELTKEEIVIASGEFPQLSNAQLQDHYQDVLRYLRRYEIKRYLAVGFSFLFFLFTLPLSLTIGALLPIIGVFAIFLLLNITSHQYQTRRAIEQECSRRGISFVKPS